MEKIAEIEYKITPERIMNSYYAKDKVSYEDYSKEIYDSMPDSMKEMSIEFYDDRFIEVNLVKKEKNTYLYDELFYIEKVENGYLFCNDRAKFNFFEFSDFKADELEKLDEILKKYYTNTFSEVTATLEDYELDKKRIITVMKTMYKKTRVILSIGYSILLGVMVYFTSQSVLAGVFIMIITYVILNLIFYFSRKRSAKKILSSINENFLGARILFYPERMENRAKKKYNLIKMNYDEFYKIEKVKKGYIFYTQKFSFYFFRFNEFKKDELEKLDVILSEYTHKKRK